MTAGSTYTPIATTTLGSNQSSVTFSSLGSYTDIVIVVGGTITVDQAIGVRFNGDTGTNYSYTRLFGDGTTATSDKATNSVFCYLGIVGTAQSTLIGHINNYGNSTTYKTGIGRGNTSTYVSTYISTWRNTAAITSMTILPAGSNSLVTGTVVTLYGIASA
jgi:hypothetical protein